MTTAVANPKSAQRVILSPEMTPQEALAHLASGAVPVEAYLEWDADRVKRIEAKAKASAAAPRELTFKVSEKGGVSVYGLGRFPVTLYKEQWTKLLAMTDEIRAFIEEHDAELKAKPQL